MESVELVGWEGPAPTPDEWPDEAGVYARALSYADVRAYQQVTVITVKRRPAVSLSASGGLAATSMQDAIRAAVVAAVNIAWTFADDRDAMRAAAKTTIGDADATWSPTPLNIDGAAVQAQQRTVLDTAWAAAAELAGCFLAVAGSNAARLSRLRFGTVRRRRAL